MHFRGKIKGSLLALMVTWVGACANQPQTKQADTASLRGVVVEQGSENPIPGAAVFLVRASNQPQLSMTTDAEGSFAFEGLAPGRHLVAVTRDGYVLPGRQNISGYPYRLNATGKPENIRIHLVPTGTIAGRVFASDGKPAKQVDVQLLQNLYLMGRRQWTYVSPGGSSRNIPVTTNERGEFRVVGLDPGQYVIRLVPHELDPATLERGASSPAPMFYPAARDVSEAKLMDVTSGGETLLDDVKLKQERRGWIRVLVLNESGTPLEGLGNWELRPQAWVGADYVLAQNRIVNEYHEFQPDTAGTYEIIASWSTSRGLLGGVLRADYRGADMELKMVVRKPDAKLTGHVMPPAPGVEVAIGPKISYFARGVADGTLIFPDMYSGRYQLGYVRGLPESSFVESVMQGKRDVLRDEIVVGPQSDPLEVVVREGAGVLTGKISDSSGKPLHHALVALVPEGALKERKDYYGAYRDTRTDQYGEFEIRGITPGSYQAYAWTDAPGSAYRNEDFLKTFVGKGTPLTVAIGARVNLDLKTLD